jgi:hypothetical protein
VGIAVAVAVFCTGSASSAFDTALRSVAGATSVAFEGITLADPLCMTGMGEHATTANIVISRSHVRPVCLAGFLMVSIGWSHSGPDEGLRTSGLSILRTLA